MQGNASRLRYASCLWFFYWDRYSGFLSWWNVISIQKTKSPLKILWWSAKSKMISIRPYLKFHETLLWHMWAAKITAISCTRSWMMKERWWWAQRALIPYISSPMICSILPSMTRKEILRMFIILNCRKSIREAITPESFVFWQAWNKTPLSMTSILSNRGTFRSFIPCASASSF